MYAQELEPRLGNMVRPDLSKGEVCREKPDAKQHHSFTYTHWAPTTYLTPPRTSDTTATRTKSMPGGTYSSKRTREKCTNHILDGAKCVERSREKQGTR